MQNSLDLSHVYSHIDKNEYVGAANATISMDIFPCECSYSTQNDPILSCGTDSCINRAIFIECSENCPTGFNCLNRRFSERRYCNIEVFEAGKKGYGLKTKQNIKKGLLGFIAGTFVIEYVGEVIPRPLFLKRIREYSVSNTKHFYFMSIKNDEVIDACKKGNIARFMNHSCAPNCELQKWVVGSRIRMGFFTTKDVEANQELTFDYKFERYGQEPQVCYCGESNCKGTIGVSKRAETIDNEDEGEFDDEVFEYDEVNEKRRVLDDDTITAQGIPNLEALQHFVKQLLYTTKPKKVSRLLKKLESSDSNIHRKFLQYHGLSVLKNILAHHSKSDPGICFQILAIWEGFVKVYRIPKSQLPEKSLENAIIESSPPPATNSLVEAFARKPMHQQSQDYEKSRAIEVPNVKQETYTPPEDYKPKSSILEGVSDEDLEALVNLVYSEDTAPQNPDSETKILRGKISEVVVKTLSKYSSSIPSDSFKRIARKITHHILDREAQKFSGDSIGEDTKEKIRKFTNKFYAAYKEHRDRKEKERHEKHGHRKEKERHGEKHRDRERSSSSREKDRHGKDKKNRERRDGHDQKRKSEGRGAGDEGKSLEESKRRKNIQV